MSTETQQQTYHGGRLIVRRLKAAGVSKIFTLSGAHIFPLYDGAKEEGIELVDTRHEQAATFAAEGWAKVTREPGVAAVTAGPGVTNAVSAIASAQSNNSPLLVLGGRAPLGRWGQGALQEIDHVPFVRPLTKLAATPESTEEMAGMTDEALRTALTPATGPVFLDLYMDQLFNHAPESDDTALVLPGPGEGPDADGGALERAAALLQAAERPVIMAGTNLYWGHGETALVELAQELQIPVFVNGMARGCIPADHELAFSRARGAGLKGCDLAIVIGVPMDFRLGFGGAFAEDAEIVVIDYAEPPREHPRPVAAELYGSIPRTLEALAAGARGGASTAAWVAHLQEVEAEKRAGEGAEAADERAPLHPLRLYKELAEVIDRDAVIVGDGGDFVSYAGKVIDSYQPGHWLDPGPFGCLGCGPGYALAAKLAHPGKQVVLLLGDGAFGFSAMEFDTLARHGVDVVGVMGNNGIWALEKHPMEMLYGYSVIAELREGTRYDAMVEALGGHGELVSTPGELKPALERAFSAGKPALVNVLTDPDVVYPRQSFGI